MIVVVSSAGDVCSEGLVRKHAPTKIRAAMAAKEIHKPGLRYFSTRRIRCFTLTSPKATGKAVRWGRLALQASRAAE